MVHIESTPTDKARDRKIGDGLVPWTMIEDVEKSCTVGRVLRDLFIIRGFEELTQISLFFVEVRQSRWNQGR